MKILKSDGAQSQQKQVQRVFNKLKYISLNLSMLRSRTVKLKTDTWNLLQDKSSTVESALSQYTQSETKGQSEGSIKKESAFYEGT